jgi:hypothetical protein
VYDEDKNDIFQSIDDTPTKKLIKRTVAPARAYLLMFIMFKEIKREKGRVGES